MKETTCQSEGRLLEALREGSAPESFEEFLREHVNGCASCAELVALYKLFQADSRRLHAAAPVPEAGRVWWRATVQARRAAAERALRPIAIAEKAALAVGGGVLLALLIAAAPWLAGQLARPDIWAGPLVNTFPLEPLVVTSVIVCVLLMAGGLYTLWAEK